MDMGGNVVPGGISFRVWAPGAETVSLVVFSAGDQVELPMDRLDDGTWTYRLEGGIPGVRYKYRLDGGESYPDPYSRFQPEGVHGPSQVVDPDDFGWHDPDTRPLLGAKGLVIYECHIGAFTPEGTFDSAIGRLAYLKDLGVSAVEVMPVAEFSGMRNWGYDGVDWFAPSRAYGGPDGFKRFVDAAHDAGLRVLLDVVYNHFGPEGNYLRAFSPDYFTDAYKTAWGGAINYEGCPRARRLATDNVAYWLREFHVDGFRLDATFAIHDDSATHLLRELSDTARAIKPNAVFIAETHENDVTYLTAGGYNFDAVWADDFHHAVRRLTAGDHEGYYGDFAGTVEEVARTINQGFLYEGQRSRFSGKERGTPAREQPAWQFVYCIQNHDQVGNRAFGDRLSEHLDGPLYRVVSVLLLLVPETPLLFMGQEFAARSPFRYFTDHSPELGRLVTTGRREEFKHFATFGDEIPDPQAESTFQASKLNWAEADNSPGREVLDLYRETLRLRRADPAFSSQDRTRVQARAASESVLAVDWAGQRLLLANFGETETSIGAPGTWQPLLDTNDGRFGGSGKRTARVSDGSVVLDSHSAVLLSAVDAVAGQRMQASERVPLFLRTYADAEGVSHAEDGGPLFEAGALPGSPALGLTSAWASTSAFFIRCEAGWYWDWHASPRRQIALTVEGEVEVGVSDGESRRLGPGSTWLHEDLVGRGHSTRVVGEGDWVALILVLGDGG